MDLSLKRCVIITKLLEHYLSRNTEKKPEDWIVAVKRVKNLIELPEDRLRVPVVVVAEWEVFDRYRL